MKPSLSHTFSHSPWILSPSALLSVHLDNGVAPHHSKGQAILMRGNNRFKVNGVCVMANGTQCRIDIYPDLFEIDLHFCFKRSLSTLAFSSAFQKKWASYLNLLHQPVLLLVICFRELVDLDFVLLDLPHDLKVHIRWRVIWWRVRISQ